MEKDSMLNGADAFLSRLTFNENNNPSNESRTRNFVIPNNSQALGTYSSNPFFSQQATTSTFLNENQKVVEIVNLREGYGNDEARQMADICTIQQIFHAIGASTVINNIQKVERINTNNPFKIPRNILVTFASEADQYFVLQNAFKLQSIHPWTDVNIKRYGTPPAITTTLQHFGGHSSHQMQMPPPMPQMQFHEPQQIYQLPQTSPPPSYLSMHSNQQYPNLIPCQNYSLPNYNNFPQHDQQIYQQQLHRQPSPNPCGMMQNCDYIYSPHSSQHEGMIYQQQQLSVPQHVGHQRVNSGNATERNMQQSGKIYSPSSQQNCQIPQLSPEVMSKLMDKFVNQYGTLNGVQQPHKQQRPYQLPKQPPTIKIESFHDSEDFESETETEPEYEEIKSIRNNALYQSQSDYFSQNGSNKKVLNILVLGETGVGKSTWINGIANYMTFDTLEDALAAPRPICLIASKFTYYVTNEEKIEVKLEPSHGEKDENEAFSDQGQSSTQEPKTYQFETAQYVVNIIDTPGIGDTRGIEQDKENTRKILNAIGTYKELHAICFLFKANEARMTLNFRYCISELLLQLHKDAVDNIIFFFTNARGTFYKPGDTMTPLTKFLSELNNDRGLRICLESKKLCCTDNEAFRLVCAYFNGAKITEEDFHNFAGSWIQSATETHRFLEFAARQKPHRVADTVSINKARTIILHLAKPLADVNELIESNVKVFEDRKNELKNTAATLSELKKKTKITQIGIEVKELPYPKTVCAAEKCIETESLPNSDQFQTIYKQICHDHCYLTGVDVERVPEQNLINCAAMRDGSCRECKCPWDTHMHIRFDQIKSTTEVEDKNTLDLIAQNESAKDIKEKMIKDCEITIKEMKDEQQKIIKTSLRFGSFLQANAILPYNDAFEKYVEHTIAEEKKCISVGGDSTKLENLKKLLNQYRQEKAMLVKASMQSDGGGGNTISPSDVENLKVELFQLKHTGKTLKHLFKATEDGIAKNNAHVTVKYTPSQMPHISKPKKNFAVPNFFRSNKSYQSYNQRP